MSISLNKEQFLRNFLQEVWNEKRFNKIQTYVHPKYHIELDAGDPWEGKTINPAEFIERLHYSFDSFPDMHFEVTACQELEDRVIVDWILTGTNLGPIGDFPATGKRIRTTGNTVYYFKDGLISGHHQVFDRITVTKQLGFLSA